MCIRDRLSEAGLSAQGLLDVVTANMEGALRSVSVSRGIDPVSYTHLRAHETVLDLVCRLLLEKKNKDNLHTSLR